MRKYWLLASFIAVFLITTPTVLLYSSGFRLDWKSGRFLKTGLLFVRSIPKNAQITLNDDPLSTKTPTRIQSLIPGDYTITVTKDDLQPWTKKLSIRENATTFADTILLFHTAPTLEKISDLNILSTYLSPDKKYITLVSAQDNTQTLWSLNLGNSELTKMLNSDVGEKIDMVVWSPETDRLIVKTNEKIVELPFAPTPKTNTLIGFPINAEKIKWSDDGQVIYYLQKQKLFSYELSNQKISTITSTLLADYQFISSDLYILKISEKGQTSLSLLRPPYQSETRSNEILYSSASIFSPTTQQYIQVQDTQKNVLHIFDADTIYELQAFPHTDYQQWSDSDSIFGLNEKATLLFGDTYEIGIYSYDIFFGAYRRSTLARYAQPMDLITWHPSFKAVLFIKDHQLFAAETDDRSGAQIFPLTELGSTPLAMIPSPNGEKVFFLFSEKAKRPGIYASSIFDQDAFLR